MSSTEPKKHPCPDCRFCQWCGDDRCALCLRKDCGRKKLSTAEQIALYEEINKKAACGEDETVDTLNEYGLKIIQPRSGYRFSVDPLLLSDFAPAFRKSILDLGTGCGIIPLIMAKKYPDACITGLEVQPGMAAIARRNVTNNSLSKNITVIEADIVNTKGQLSPDCFDLVISNPPYRRLGEGKVSPRSGRDLARHESTATLRDFLVVAKKMVLTGGSICFIYQSERLAELLALALELKLSPARLQMVHGDRDLPARMFMIELLKGRKSALEVLPPVFVKGSVYGERQQDGMRRGI